MRRLYAWSSEVSQVDANQGVGLVESHLCRFGVSRAMELPEEARIRLLRDLRIYFKAIETDDEFEVQKALYRLKQISWGRWCLVKISRFLFG